MNRRQSTCLKVELFAGTEILAASQDLCDLAGRIGTLVEADFNGVKLWARPGDNPQSLADDYLVQLGSKHAYKIAQARNVTATTQQEK